MRENILRASGAESASGRLRCNCHCGNQPGSETTGGVEIADSMASRWGSGADDSSPAGHAFTQSRLAQVLNCCARLVSASSAEHVLITTHTPGAHSGVCTAAQTARTGRHGMHFEHAFFKEQRGAQPNKQTTSHSCWGSAKSWPDTTHTQQQPQQSAAVPIGARQEHAASLDASVQRVIAGSATEPAQVCTPQCSTPVDALWQQHSSPGALAARLPLQLTLPALHLAPCCKHRKAPFTRAPYSNLAAALLPHHVMAGRLADHVGHCSRGLPQDAR
jgi:hypothetical protein